LKNQQHIPRTLRWVVGIVITISVALAVSSAADANVFAYAIVNDSPDSTVVVPAATLTPTKKKIDLKDPPNLERKVVYRKRFGKWQ
jgi:hypothetical protein